MILIHIHFLCVINNLTLQLSYHLAQRLRPRLCLVRLLVSVSLNLAIVCTASVSNVYSCPPAAPAWCDNCFPMLSPAWHLHRCHGPSSGVGSPRKQRGLDEDPHKQCQHFQPIKILFFVKSLITYLNSLDHVCVSKGESICSVFSLRKGEKLEI